VRFIVKIELFREITGKAEKELTKFHNNPFTQKIFRENLLQTNGKKRIVKMPLENEILIRILLFTACLP
jgi:hypothetical protein